MAVCLCVVSFVIVYSKEAGVYRDCTVGDGRRGLLVDADRGDLPLRNCSNTQTNPSAHIGPNKAKTAPSKFEGSATASLHVFGHPELAYAGPAQSPHTVMSKMRFCARKWLMMSHCVFGKNAVGVPQLSGFGFLLVTSAGTASRSKNQTEMPSASSVCAKTPPACMLKPCPYEVLPVCWYAQPALFPSEDAHDVPRMRETASAVLSSVQPAPEWRVIWFAVLVFTPSVDEDTLRLARVHYMGYCAPARG